MADDPVQRYAKRWSDLQTERSTWIPHWQEISRYILPRNGRFLLTDRNVGTKRHNDIYDSTATRANRTLAAGLMAGMTSPARPWFRLATSDPDLMESSNVKQWLSHVTALMRLVFNKSNTYPTLHNLYEELGAFGTASTIIVPDYDTVIHQHALTAGQYAISTNSKGEVDTLYREFEMTLAQMAQQFGVAALRPELQGYVRQHERLDTWFPVVHAIEPREAAQRQPGKKDGRNMQWASVYYESGSSGPFLLRESGFKRFPGLGMRWHTMGGDIYGNSPGMEALGDVKELKHAQLRKSQGLDYIVKPPMQVPVELKDTGVDLLPGGLNYVANVTAGARPMFDVRPDINAQLADIADIRQRINETFYVNLFLMLESADLHNLTAREVAERHEEKMLMLGPVLERLHGEGLSPLIDVTFDRMLAAGIVPQPPAELNGQDLNVEFVSVLAQAQRAVNTVSMDRLLGTVASMAQLKPDMLDKIDGDAFVDAYSDAYGIDPDLIVSSEKVALIRQDRAKQMAAQQAMAAAPAMAGAAKNMAQAQQAGGDLMAGLQGYGIPMGAQQ